MSETPTTVPSPARPPKPDYANVFLEPAHAITTPHDDVVDEETV